MSYYVVVFLVVLLCIYGGKVIGLMIHCDNCDELKHLRNQMFMVPIVEFIMHFYCIWDCLRDKNWKLLRTYFTFENRGIVIAYVMADAKKEAKRVRQKRIIKKQERYFTLDMIKSVLSETFDVGICRYQFM
jgi:hypothetical protein